MIGLAGGLGVNDLSEGFGFETVAVAAGVGSVLSATIWLRQRPRAPMVRMASRVFLVLAAFAAVAALSGPASWVGPAVIVASLSATAAVLIPSKSDEGVATLFGTAFVGIGVAAIGGGAKFLRGGDVLDGIVAIASGAAFIGMGVGRLRRSSALLALALIGLGVTFIGAGATDVQSGLLLAGIASIGPGWGLSG